jgi:ATP-dependent protease ClpP protease subunit
MRNKPNNNKHLGSEIGTNVNPFAAYAREKVVTVYTLPVLSTIETPEDFIAHVSILNGATEDDLVIMHVSSLGGSLGAVDYLLYAMENCLAEIHVEATGYLMSAATLIPLYADKVNISDNCEILIHNCTWGNGGKHSDVMEYALYSDKMNKLLLDRYYGDMFTADEMEKLYAGKQFYMTNEEYLDRMVRQYEIRHNRLKEEVSLESLSTEALQVLSEQLEAKPPAKVSRKKKTS